LFGEVAVEVGDDAVHGRVDQVRGGEGVGPVLGDVLARVGHGPEEHGTAVVVPADAPGPYDHVGPGDQVLLNGGGDGRTIADLAVVVLVASHVGQPRQVQREPGEVSDEGEHGAADLAVGLAR